MDRASDENVRALAAGLRRARFLGFGAVLAAGLILIGCERASPQPPAAKPARALSALEIVLAAHRGESDLDERIRKLQKRIPDSQIPAQDLERLGWLFVARAREGDAGLYNLALQCALAIEIYDQSSAAASLLRGHALHSLHHFVSAEAIARKLVAERGLPFDHGLLGDVLVDRGEIDAAAAAYQQMMNQRPDMHSYARAAHVRYLKGDLPGALEAMNMAARAASPRNRESFAWTWSKLAHYQLQAGDPAQAEASVQRALEVQPSSAQALKVSAQINLARSAYAPALTQLRAAVASAPHPELAWMAIEACEALGLTVQANAFQKDLLAAGEREDARALALYLGTIGRDLERAEALVRSELEERHDSYTYEALAWVQSARGQHALALENARRSLASGTPDPRLYYHAGLIAQRAGAADDARSWLTRARAGARLLLPSQQEQLLALAGW